MNKLPAISTLKREIETLKVAESIAFVKAKQASLERFEDVEDLVFQIDLDNPPTDLRGFEYHFRQVRSALAKALWSRGLFIGLSVLDDLLFSGFRSKPPADPVARALLIIKDNDVHKPGFVLYPIHSLGVNGVGFFEFFTRAKVQLAIASAGLVLRAQTNSMDGSVGFLNAAKETFSISKRISRENIEHYYRSRSTKWLCVIPNQTSTSRPAIRC